MDGEALSFLRHDGGAFRRARNNIHLHDKHMRTSISILCCFILVAMQLMSAQNSTIIEYHAKAPEGLVGNGRSIVKVSPGGFAFHSGGSATGSFRLVVDGKTFELAAEQVHSTFFPGGVLYGLDVAGQSIEILHGAAENHAYIVAVRVKGRGKDIALEVHQEGGPALRPTGRIPFPKQKEMRELILSTESAPSDWTFDGLRRQWEAHYRTGFVLHSPSSLVDRAVPFNRYLLDLGFDGHLHVCELFRWRDVWSRDLGSGLVPGAMASGQFARARTTIEYDLHRYATKNPRGLKVTEDPSQGGSAEGTAWLTRAVWRYYLLTGDREFLASASGVLMPWVNAWIDRDSRNEGVLVDVTEWMDHSRFFLFPDGARVLYSNVLFADLLGTFSKVKLELGDTATARRLTVVKDRFIAGINSLLWNDTTGEYDNLSLWGRRDERSSSAENALAILCRVAPQERIARILGALREHNWRAAGSTTIFPPMSHVDTTIDHNYKMWPWWNAVEARARLRNGDINGGIHLLECCSRTLEDMHYPGLMEELTSPQGITEGGNAFLTAAGSYQDAIIEGLLGIEILEPGCRRIRVSPNTPTGWDSWDATVPLPGGAIFVTQIKGRLRIRVTDPRVRIVEAPSRANVEGADRAPLSPSTFPVLAALAEVKPLPFPPLVRRSAALLYDTTLYRSLPTGMARRTITPDELPRLDSTNISALIIPGNALPLKTASGEDTRLALSRFLERGNAIVFYGATMHDRGTMGETGGVIDWYDYRPAIVYHPLGGWRFKASRDGIRVPQEKETGFVKGWFRPDFADDDWGRINVPGLWEDYLKQPYDGWGWYRIHFPLSEGTRGKTVFLDLGEIDDADWTYVNGRFIGSESGWQRFRRYVIRPTDSAYAALRFGGDNVLAVQVFDGGGGGGLYADSTWLGTETDRNAWMPIDARTGITRMSPERFGVVSWGPGGDFFNSWETSRGAFGFKIDGRGIDFAGPLAGVPSRAEPVQEAFTDFAISAPLIFQPLAYTATHRRLLIPDHGERYPCMARIVNMQSGGELVLIPASIARLPVGLEVLRRLMIE